MTKEEVGTHLGALGYYYEERQLPNPHPDHGFLTSCEVTFPAGQKAAATYVDERNGLHGRFVLPDGSTVRSPWFDPRLASAARKSILNTVVSVETL